MYLPPAGASCGAASLPPPDSHQWILLRDSTVMLPLLPFLFSFILTHLRPSSTSPLPDPQAKVVTYVVRSEPHIVVPLPLVRKYSGFWVKHKRPLGELLESEAQIKGEKSGWRVLARDGEGRILETERRREMPFCFGVERSWHQIPIPKCLESVTPLYWYTFLAVSGNSKPQILIQSFSSVCVW